MSKDKLSKATKADRTEAQIAAERRYNAKRRGQPALPASRLTEEENKLVTSIFEQYTGSRKDAIIEGLVLLAKKKKMNIKSV